MTEIVATAEAVAAAEEVEEATEEEEEGAGGMTTNTEKEKDWNDRNVEEPNSPML